MSEPLALRRVTYHGGFSHLDVNEVPSGWLVAEDEVLTLNEKNRASRDHPPVEICRTSSIAGIEISSEPPRSKVRDFAFFGLIGAAIAAGEEGPMMIVHLKNGEAGYFTIGHQTAASVLGTISPWMRERGITLGPN